MYKRLFIITALFGLSLFLSPTPSQANIITVNGTCTLADAIIAANTDTATGSCDAGSPGADTIVLDVDVSLTSVYPGSTAIGGGQSGLPDITSAITIQAGFQATIDANENNYRHLYVAPSGSLTLTNVTITGGYLNQPGGSAYGGAIYADGDLTLTDTDVVFNSVDGNVTRGGAIYVGPDGSLTIDGVSEIDLNFSNGTVLGDGGAIYAEGVINSISAQSIGSNTATRSGGAIYADTINSISNTQFEGHEAGTSGGTIFVNHVGTIENSTFTDSTAFTGNGGAIAITNSLLSVDQVGFYNVAATEGGAIWIESTNGVNATISNVELGVACAASSGGGIYLGSQAIVTVTSSIFDGLTVCDNALPDGSGGAIYSEGNLTVSNSTFESYWGLLAKNTGGAIQNVNGTLVVQDSIFEDNQVLGETFAAGGAIYSIGDLTVVRTRFFVTDATVEENNVSKGGAIYSVGQANIAENEFIFSSASSKFPPFDNLGGAIYAQGQADITNNFFHGSFIGHWNELASGGSGGAIYLDASQASTVLHNTFTNSSALNGETLYANGPIAVNGNIFASEGYGTLGNSPDCMLLSGVTGSNNLHLTGDTSCDSVSVGTIQLDTHIKESTGLLQSVFGNPAIDGNPGCGLATDGLGNPRIGACDIGYHELQLSSPTPVFTPTATLTPTPTITPTMTTLTVNSLADTDDGICDVTHCTLREAVAASNTAVGANTINFAVSGTILLGSQLGVTGSVTINGSDITLDGNDVTRIMQISSGITVTLNNLTFQNGTTFGDGGAINNAGTLTIANGTLTDNSTNGSFSNGGAIYNQGALTIANSTLSGNTANGSSSYGGAIYDGYYSTLTIADTTFSNNSSTNRSGGAIYDSHGTLEITGSTFSGNTAYSGGAIGNSGTLTITSSSFSNNVATNYRGGAIDHSDSSIVAITDSTFSGNTAASAGGAINFFGSNIVTITRSTFSGNTAASAGAIYNGSSLLDITNSTLSGNTANGLFSSSGGAIYNSNGVLTVTSNTFSGNSATNGGTISNSKIINVTSSIIVGGSCSGTITGGGNNLSFNATGCPGTVADPQLGPLQNNGGLTDTMLPALIGPAVDAYAAPCATTTDQRGIARPQGSGCDIGATEQEGPVPTDTPIPPTDTLIPPTDTPIGPASLVASATCVDENLAVTISAGDGPFNITASAGINTPVNGVGVGTTTINGPEKWDNLTVTETGGDMETTNLGQFRCRSDERPVPLSPAHRSRTTNPFPTFSWTGITGANNYRVFVFDDANPATRTVDIRQNSGGPTSMILSTPLPTGRLFWRVRARTNRVWSYWSIRFTLFVDPPAIQPAGVTPVPTIDLEQPASTPVPPTFPAPPNSR